VDGKSLTIARGQSPLDDHGAKVRFHPVRSALRRVSSTNGLKVSLAMRIAALTRKHSARISRAMFGSSAKHYFSTGGNDVKRASVWAELTLSLRRYRLFSSSLLVARIREIRAPVTP